MVWIWIIIKFQNKVTVTFLWVMTHVPLKMHQLIKFDGPRPHSAQDMMIWTQFDLLLGSNTQLHLSIHSEKFLKETTVIYFCDTTPPPSPSDLHQLIRFDSPRHNSVKVMTKTNKKPLQTDRWMENPICFNTQEYKNVISLPRLHIIAIINNDQFILMI